jgi:hypothetical protein
VRTTVDALLRSEAERFKLRFTCEDCAHFSPETRACVHGYPTEAHQGIRLEATTTLEFCKEFELV